MARKTAYEEVTAVLNRLTKISLVGVLLVGGARVLAAWGLGVLMRIGHSRAALLPATAGGGEAEEAA